MFPFPWGSLLQFYQRKNAYNGGISKIKATDEEIRANILMQLL